MSETRDWMPTSVQRPSWWLPAILSALTHVLVLSLLPHLPPQPPASHEIVSLQIQIPTPDPPRPLAEERRPAPPPRPPAPRPISAPERPPPPSPPRAAEPAAPPSAAPEAPASAVPPIAAALPHASGPSAAPGSNAEPMIAGATAGSLAPRVHLSGGEDASAAKTRSDLKAYQRGLYEAVQAGRRYPPAARHLGLEGRAVLSVAVDRSGHLVRKPKIVQSTSHEILDLEAVRMVEAAAPFPPLPNGYERGEAEFLIPIRFRLRD